MERSENPILNLSFEFALKIIDFTEDLNCKGKFVVSKQLLKSGTSIGANVREAQNSESRFDFIHKMKIAAKEACETEYWLLLCKESAHYPTNDILLQNIIVILKILNKIIASAKRNKSH